MIVQSKEKVGWLNTMEPDEDDHHHMLFNHSKKLQITQFLSAFIGFIGMIISINTPYWYLVYPNIRSGNGYFGLFCGGEINKDCSYERENVLEFSDDIWPFKHVKAKDLDIVCLFLIISTILTFTGCISPIFFFSCRRRFQSALCTTALLLFGTVSSFIALCHFEKKVAINETKQGTFKHGWSSILCWLSFAFVLVATIVSLALLKLKRMESRNPVTYYDNHEERHYHCNIYEPAPHLL